MIDLNKGRILVTGGAGFIGSALVWALNKRGITNILIVDLLRKDTKWKNLVSLKYEDYLEAEDFQELLALNPSQFSDVSLVFHLGACSATTEKDASYLVRNNFEWSKQLAQWALSQEIRFVYASSAATYGGGELGMDDHIENLHALRPLNMYGYSKHMFDLYAQKHEILNKLVGIKYFNVYGPNENHKGDMRSLVNKAYDQILKTGKVDLFKSYLPEYNDGEQMRDFLYVKDAVEMTIHLAESEFAGGIYNLGSGEANTWVSLATAIFDALNMKTKIEFIDMPDDLKDKYQYYTKASIDKLRSSGYEKEIFSLQNAVSDYVKNYLVPNLHLGDENS
jgi:ADP-L-glycero-D-manno-heptose 6-epimerase